MERTQPVPGNRGISKKPPCSRLKGDLKEACVGLIWHADSGKIGGTQVGGEDRLARCAWCFRPRRGMCKGMGCETLYTFVGRR